MPPKRADATSDCGTPHSLHPTSSLGGVYSPRPGSPVAREDHLVALSHFRINFGDLMGLNLVFPSLAIDHGLVICCSVGSGVSRLG